MEAIVESIYDHPKYYDLVFGSDCAAELRFIEQCSARYLQGKRCRRMFEPACGTGRLLSRLAKRGYAVSGIDLNSKAIEFCNARLVRGGFKPTTFVADMSDFVLPSGVPKFDVAFNTINSFRHLRSDREGIGHFRSMAAAIRDGGLYLLGLHLRPTEANPSETESWSARRGHLMVKTHMWTLERDLPKRLERFGIEFEIYTPLRQFRIEDELLLRSYTDRELRSLIQRSGGWDVVATYDFQYQIDQPIDVDGTCEDVVYVLRRRGA